jgi:hypothetical protein
MFRLPLPGSLEGPLSSPVRISIKPVVHNVPAHFVELVAQVCLVVVFPVQLRPLEIRYGNHLVSLSLKEPPLECSVRGRLRRVLNKVRRAVYLDSNLPGGRLRVSIPDNNVDVWMMARNLSKVTSRAVEQQDASGHRFGWQRSMHAGKTRTSNPSSITRTSNPLLACRKAIARRDGKCSAPKRQ